MADNDQLGMSEKAFEKVIMDAVSSKEAFFNTVWNFARDKAAEMSGEFVREHSPDMIKKIAGDRLTKSQAETIGRIAGTTTQVSVAVGQNIKQFAEVGKDTVQRVRKLRKEVAPYLAEEKLRDNEVTRNEMKRTLGRGKYEFYGAATGLVVLMPDLLKMRAGQGEDPKKTKNYGTAESHKAKKVDAESKLGKVALGFDRADGFVRRQVANLPNPSDDIRQKTGLVVKFFTPRLQQIVDRKCEEELGGPTAYDLIKDLSRQVDKTNGPIGKVMHKGTKDRMPLQKYVLEVFKQHQLDSEAPELNDRRSSTDLEEACQLIADAIDRRQIEPKSLIALVGGRAVLDADLNVADTEEVTAILREVQRSAERAEKVNMKTYFSDSVYTDAQEIREIFDELGNEDKAFFASLFPDAVLRDGCGLKQAEIDDLKDTAFEGFSETLGQAVKELAEMSQQDLQRSGLTKKESELIHKWAKSIDEDNPGAFFDGMDGDTQSVAAAAVANARTYWQDKVSGGANRRDQIEEPATSEQGLAEKEMAQKAAPQDWAEKHKPGERRTKDQLRMRKEATTTDMTVPKEWTKEVAGGRSKGDNREPALR